MGNRNVHQNILDTLASYGITNMTVDDLVVEFQGIDSLADCIIDPPNGDVAEAIWLNINKYLELTRAAEKLLETPIDMNPTAEQGVDPTGTQQGAGVAMPTAPQLTDSERLGIAETLAQSAAVRQLNTDRSALVGILADKPWPGKWMSESGKLHIKGDVNTKLKNWKDVYKPEAETDEILVRGAWCIPTTAQLQEIKAQHQKSIGSKQPPAWYGFDNTAAFAEIESILSSGDPTFDPYIPPEDDMGVGADKAKAWRWNTKGFIINMPDTAAGSDVNVDKHVTKQQLQGMLVTTFDGTLNPTENTPLGCTLTLAKRKNTGTAGAAADAKKQNVRLRIVGNSTINRNRVHYTMQVGEGKKQMFVRSAKFFYMCKLNDEGKIRIKKERLPLVWEQGPVWEPVPEYADFINALGQNMERVALQANREAQQAMAEQMMTAKDREAYGIGDFFRGVEEAANAMSAKAAEELGVD